MPTPWPKNHFQSLTKRIASHSFVITPNGPPSRPSRVARLSADRKRTRRLGRFGRLFQRPSSRCSIGSRSVTLWHPMSSEQLRRFHAAQETSNSGFAAALAELATTGKRGHWIWYVFPQLVGLGVSDE